MYLAHFLIGATFMLMGSQSARILIFQTVSARSHVIVLEPLVEELAARGHQLTLFTCFPHSTPVPNLKEFNFSHKAYKVVNNVSFDEIADWASNQWKIVPYMGDWELESCKEMIFEEPFQELLKSNNTYDLVMAEAFASECYVPFAYKFKAPLIRFITSSVLPWVADDIGLPDNPAYTPIYFGGFSTPANFMARLKNTVTLVYSKLVHHYYVNQLQLTSFITNHFGSSVPPLDSLLKNTSLVFVNSHFTISTSRPFPPNFVEIGGIHIRNYSTSPNNQEFQELLDQTPQGVVICSFGSLVRTSTIPQPIIRAFLNVFAKLPQTVIFKYEDPLPDVPPNVVVRKWLPQQQLISHKHVKAIITHGGLASIIEAVHFGKPVVGIPFFADQHLNIISVANRGAGILLHLDDLTDTTIEHSVLQILNNPSYRENMERLSWQFRDRPMTALQSAVYWTEYVIRHKGAPHLKPASVDLPLYQYLLLDVIAVLLLPLFFLFYIIYFFFFRAVHLSPNDEALYNTKKTN